MTNPAAPDAPDLEAKCAELEFALSQAHKVFGAEITSMQAVLQRDRERIAELEAALTSMLAEWEKFTRYGSPMAKHANITVTRARATLGKPDGDRG